MDIPIKIRHAESSDDVLLAEFGARTFYDSFAADNTPEDMAVYLAESFSPEIQAEELADPSSVFFIAEVEGEVAGYARLKENWVPVGITGERPVELVRIYAGAEWIGKGVGNALMEACIREAERLGYDSIWLGVWEHNQRAQAFYRSWGFDVAGTHQFQLGADIQTDLIMQRSVGVKNIS